MSLTQLSIPLANRPGELSQISDLMGDEGVNIRAITASVNGADARIHFITDNPDKAESVLAARDYTVERHEVIAVETPDHPGGLSAVLRPLKAAGINIEFCYPMIGRHKGNAVLVLGVEPLADAVAALERDYIAILDPDAETL